MFKSGKGRNTLKPPQAKTPGAPRPPRASIARDGYMAEGREFYQSQDWSILRTATLKRDGGRCRMCGSRANLQAHHLRPRFKSGEDNLANTITLCEACHDTLHPHSIIRR